MGRKSKRTDPYWTTNHIGKVHGYPEECDEALHHLQEAVGLALN